MTIKGAVGSVGRICGGGSFPVDNEFFDFNRLGLGGGERGEEGGEEAEEGGEEVEEGGEEVEEGGEVEVELVSSWEGEGRGEEGFGEEGFG